MKPEDKMKVPGEFDVIACDLRDFNGDWTQMHYGDPQSDRAKALLSEFAVQEAIAGQSTEFEEMLALEQWVRGRWNHGWSVHFDDVKDGLDILRFASKGEQFCCGHYAMVFVDCAAALGWPARLVSLSIENCGFPRNHNVGNVGHAVAEIWSNDYEKWIAIDADLNCYYQRDGLPLSALEISQAWHAREHEQVELVQGQPEFVVPSGENVRLAGRRTPGLNIFTEETCELFFVRFGRHRAIDYYARVSINGWEWVDHRCLPTFVRHFAPSGQARWTSNVTDLYWSLNMVRMRVQPNWQDEKASLRITPEHCMPWFDHYEARIDEGEWQRVEDSFDWHMCDGENYLQVRAVNVTGRAGITSSVRVAYSPAMW